MPVHLARGLGLFQVLEKLGRFTLQGPEWILLTQAWIGAPPRAQNSPRDAALLTRRVFLKVFPLF